jgi:hypothetical protein
MPEPAGPPFAALPGPSGARLPVRPPATGVFK